MIHYVTAVDRGYLLKTVCLLQSFLRQGSVGRFWCFAGDQSSADLLRRLDPGSVVVVEETEYQTPALRAVQAQRSRLEYACTAKPFIVQHVMRQAAAGDWVVWLDGDTFCFRPAEQIVPATAASVLLTPHRFTESFRYLEETAGTFNAGLVGFRNSDAGTSAVEWWARRCLEWCSARPEPGRYTDQKYLESFSSLFPEVHEVAALGVNAAPWNAVERDVRQSGQDVLIDGQPLVLYHFQGLQIISRRLVDLYSDDRVRLPLALQRLVYRPYVQALREALRSIREVIPNFGDGMASGFSRSVLRPMKRWLLRRGNLVVVGAA